MKIRKLSNTEMVKEYSHLINDRATEDRLYFFSIPRKEYLDTKVERTHFIATNDQEEIIGAAHLSGSSADDTFAILQYVTVDPEYQNKGIARTLMGEVFEYVSNLDGITTLNLGDFSHDGDEYLRNIVREGVAKYPDMITADIEEQSFEDWLNGVPVDDFAP